MTKNEIKLPIEVDKLLKDICKFLNEEIDGGSFSKDSRQIATKLVERISTISLNISDPINEAYVDMQGCKVSQPPIDLQEVYSDVSLTFEGISNSSTVNEENKISPYANFPAVEVKGHKGYLFKKEKFFIFEQQKKVFAAIQQSWLLIYMNENSLKPCQTFDLTDYEVKSCESQKNSKKRDDSFDLISLIDGKSYHFTALTGKDIIQWLTAINRHSKASTRSLPPLPAYNVTDEDIEFESSNDYEPLKEYRISYEKQLPNKPAVNVTESKVLPLPPRNSKPKTKVIPKIPSQESLDNEYDCVGRYKNSFSEDEDAHYDNPTDINQTQPLEDFEQKSIVTDEKENDNCNEDDIYDVLQNPTESKLPIQVEIPKQAASFKSKMLYFSNKRKK